jgi:hypothetical protein
MAWRSTTAMESLVEPLQLLHMVIIIPIARPSTRGKNRSGRSFLGRSNPAADTVSLKNYNMVGACDRI